MNAGAIRGFIVALVVSLGTPLLFIGAAISLGGDANLASIFTPLLAGAFPFTVIPGIPVWLKILLSVAQMVALSALFVRYTRGFRLRDQLVAALISFGVIAIIGDFLYMLLGMDLLHTHFFWA